MAVVAAVVLGGCGGSDSPDPPSIEQAQPFADGFVQRLVTGDWDAVVDDVAPLLRVEARSFQQAIHRDGIRQVLGPGRLRHDCPPSPAVDAGQDCFLYELQGEQVVPVAGKRQINAQYRLWVSYEDGAWQVINYDYDVVPGMDPA